MTEFSTDDVDLKAFRPHGRVSFSVIDDNFVIYRAWGPFNLELIDAFGKAEADVLKKLKKDGGNWVEIVVFEGSCLASAEVISAFGSYLKELKEEGMVPMASASVINDDVEGASVMAEVYRTCYEDAGVTFQIFKNEIDASSWVQSFLA